MTINLEKDHLCDYNGCVLYVKHVGTCRDYHGHIINGPRATVIKCPCNNCSPTEPDSPLNELHKRLYGEFTKIDPDSLIELQKAVDLYIYRNVMNKKFGELESVDDFIERTADICLTNVEYAIELLAREKEIVDWCNKLNEQNKSIKNRSLKRNIAINSIWHNNIYDEEGTVVIKTEYNSVFIKEKNHTFITKYSLSFFKKHFTLIWDPRDNDD